MNPQEENFQSNPGQASQLSQSANRPKNITSGLGVTMNLGFGSSLPSGSKKEKRFPIPKTGKSTKGSPPQSTYGIVYFLWSPESPGFSFSKKPYYDYKLGPEFKEEYLKGKFDTQELVRVIDRLRQCPNYEIMNDSIFKHTKLSVMLLAANCAIMVPILAYLGIKLKKFLLIQNICFIFFLILLAAGGYFAFKAYDETKLRDILRTKEFNKVIEIENENFEKEDEETKKGILILI